MAKNDYERFANLTFDDFKELAQDNSLSKYERIGFPKSYREGKEDLIFKDIVSKLKHLNERDQTILDIGPGCSDLPNTIIDLCRENNHTLILADSEEMLSQLPNESFIIKVPGFYPRDCSWLFEKYAGRVNTILAYSIIHYIFAEANYLDFIDKSLTLLTGDGEMLIGDIPNISKRKRFFSTAEGIKYHQMFTGEKGIPKVDFNVLELEKIDDSVISSILFRYRSAGFESYLLPQSDSLPMANRREDILLRKL